MLANTRIPSRAWSTAGEWSVHTAALKMGSLAKQSTYLPLPNGLLGPHIITPQRRLDAQAANRPIGHDTHAPQPRALLRAREVQLFCAVPGNVLVQRGRVFGPRRQASWQGGQKIGLACMPGGSQRQMAESK